MKTAGRWATALAIPLTLALAGCRTLDGDALHPDATRLGADPGAELGIEVGALDAWLAGRGLVAITTLIVFMTAAALGTRALASWLRRRGLDPEGRASRLLTLALVGIAGLATYGAFLRMVRLAPVLTTLMLLVGTVVVLVGNLAALQNLIAGAGMALRGTVTPGLHVRIGDDEGVVDRAGPLTVGLRTADEALVLIPNRRFSREAFTIRNASRTAQVAIRYPWPRPLRPCDVEAARNLVLLCPYHQADLDVATDQGDDDRTLLLRFHTSTEALADLARSWMYDALDEHVGRLAEGAPPRG